VLNNKHGKGQHLKYIQGAPVRKGKQKIRLIKKLTRDNFPVFHALKIGDDVPILSLQEEGELPFNECNQATIQIFLPHLTSSLVFLSSSL
jgi:hypothetical protein